MKTYHFPKVSGQRRCAVGQRAFGQPGGRRDVYASSLGGGGLLKDEGGAELSALSVPSSAPSTAAARPVPQFSGLGVAGGAGVDGSHRRLFEGASPGPWRSQPKTARRACGASDRAVGAHGDQPEAFTGKSGRRQLCVGCCARGDNWKPAG